MIDPRTLRPLDLDTILASVRKTNRAVIVEEGWPHGGVGANLATLITEQAFDHLDAPVQRVTGADVHMPYSKRLEQAAIPHEEHVVSAALATFRARDHARTHFFPHSGNNCVLSRSSSRRSTAFQARPTEKSAATRKMPGWAARATVQSPRRRMQPAPRAIDQ